MACLVLGKFEGKCEGKKIERKKNEGKKKLKINKLFLYTTSNFYLFI